MNTPPPCLKLAKFYTVLCKQKTVNKLMCNPTSKIYEVFLNETTCVCVCVTQKARKLKKVQAKKLVKLNKSKILFPEIAFLAVLNFFPVSSKIDFWPFLKLQKMELNYLISRVFFFLA